MPALINQKKYGNGRISLTRSTRLDDCYTVDPIHGTPRATYHDGRDTQISTGAFLASRLYHQARARALVVSRNSRKL